jgi:hypothetical protein
MMITKIALPRRTFLRGVGASIALPFLDAMAPALTALSKTAPIPRLGFVYVPNGIQMVNYLPQTEGKAFEMTPILSPLSEFREHMTVVSGLANHQGDALDGGSGPHTRTSATWLNGVRAKHTEGADIRQGTTIDQFAAQKLGKETPLASLELALEPNFTVGNCEGGYSCVYLNTCSWKTPTTPLQMETNPHVVFERMFGDGSSGEARRAQIAENRSILDAVTGDMSRLRSRLGSGDRQLVDRYADAVRDVELRLQRTAERNAESPMHDRPLGIPESFEEHAGLMFDLLAIAYQADITRVATFQIAREISLRPYPELGVPEGHHDISHHQNIPARMAKNTKINVYHMQLFSKFVRTLRDTADGDGSLLDHSMILYGAGMGDGNLHSPHDLPTVILGGLGGQIQTGRHLRAPVDTPFMNLGLSLLDKVGVDVPSIGDSTGRLSGI